MNLLLVSLNYHPELTGIGVYNRGFAESLADAAHEVTVFCTFPYYPRWKKEPQDRFAFYRREQIEKVHVERCFTYVPARPSSMKRVLHEGVFAFLAFWRMLFGARPDVIIAISPPFLGMVAAACASRLRNIPLHIHIQDLQPDAAIDLGMLKGERLIRILLAMERFAYRQASLVSCIGEAMLERVRTKGIADAKLLLFRNWITVESANNPVHPSQSQFRAQRNLEGRFIVLHAGNMGEKQALDVLLDVAALAQEARDDMMFVLVGDGGQRDNLQRKATIEGLRNVLFLDVQPWDAFIDILNTADLSVLLQRASVKDIVVPSKLLNILATGSPLVASVHAQSETAIILKELSVKVVVPPESPAELYRAIVSLRRSPELLEQLRHEERALANRLFLKSAIIPPVIERLKGIVNR